jgi:four helix bundle protein
LPKAADAAATRSSPDSSASPLVSTSELDYQLLLARDLGHLPSDAHAHLAEEVSEVRRMLYRFIQSLNAESG